MDEVRDVMSPVSATAVAWEVIEEEGEGGGEGRGRRNVSPEWPYTSRTILK